VVDFPYTVILCGNLGKGSFKRRLKLTFREQLVGGTDRVDYMLFVIPLLASAFDGIPALFFLLSYLLRVRGG